MAIGPPPPSYRASQDKRNAANAAKDKKPIVNPIVRGYQGKPEKPKPTPEPMGTKAVWRGGRQVNPNYKPQHKQSPGTEGKRTTYRFKEFDRYNAKDQDPNKIKSKVSQKSGVLKDIHDLKKIKSAAQRRTFREKKGLYLGKYYGPDQFRGDKKLNAAWEKSGRKGSASEFMKKQYNRNTGRGD